MSKMPAFAGRVKSLVNCVNLPPPKTLKPKAKMRWSDQLPKQLEGKDPLFCGGKQCEFGFSTRGYGPTAFASNRHNEKQALLARVLCDTIEPDDSLADCLNWCKANHRQLFPFMRIVQPVPWEQYLERSNASPSVKKVLQQTKLQLDAEGVTIDLRLTRSQLYSYTKRASFVKVENDLYESPLGRKHKAPRLIQGAQPEFIVLVGPWIMALQDLLKRRWGKDNFICFTSGLTAEQAAEHIVGGAGPWLEDDLGKFDSSIRRPWCEYEVWLCKKFGAPRAVLDLMQANINTHGSTHHGWKYKCDGTRKSGDPYTSLMNSIINGVSHCYLYCKWTDRSVESARTTLRMLVQGDDNCMRHVEHLCFPWKEGMAGLGFDSEAIYRRNLFEVEFCSCRLYPTNSGVTFGPKPGRVLAKLGYIINPPANVSRESMMRGIALGLKRNCEFIPPLKSVIERVLALTDGHDAWYRRKHFSPFEENMLKVSKPREATHETLYALNVVYDWDYGRQKMFDREVQSLQFGDEWHGIVDTLLDRDTGGPQDIFGSWVPTNVPAAA